MLQTPPKMVGCAASQESASCNNPQIWGILQDMPRNSTRERLAELAEEQWGLVTRRQVEKVGIPQTTLERLTAHGSILERVARGVYRLVGAPAADHLELRAAWLQLAPAVPAGERKVEQGVVSHRSAAALYGLGHLPADRHEFTVGVRRQSRRPDVRVHVRRLEPHEIIQLRGLPVTRPSRIAADLLQEREEPEAVAHVVADAIRGINDYPGTFADALAPHAIQFGLRRNDGLAVLRWLLDLVGDRDTGRWMEEARAHVAQAAAKSNNAREPPLPRQRRAG
jgi:Transcriptional regulator, AbiEi antitoxin